MVPYRVQPSLNILKAFTIVHRITQKHKVSQFVLLGEPSLVKVAHPVVIDYGFVSHCAAVDPEQSLADLLLQRCLSNLSITEDHEVKSVGFILVSV